MARLVSLLVAISLVGCMSAPPATSLSPVPREEIEKLAGTWQGWLITERSFALFNLDIKNDGTFEVRGPWTRAAGVLLVADSQLRFDGTGAWRGTLTLKRNGDQRVLTLERDDRLVRGNLHPVQTGG
jgi:hypothetical protein